MSEEATTVSALNLTVRLSYSTAPVSPSTNVSSVPRRMVLPSFLSPISKVQLLPGMTMPLLATMSIGVAHAMHGTLISQ